MSFKEFKKEIERRKEQETTMRELNAAISTLTSKRDKYAEEAKKALKSGNESQYRAMVALLKNAIFNLKQAQDMVANFTIARDMCEMQSLNKRFVKSLNSVMNNVYKTCKAIHVSTCEKTFMKALYQQNQTSAELQQALQNNNITFSNSVNTLSDISDEEVKAFIQDDIDVEEAIFEDSLSKIEQTFSGVNAQGETKVEPVMQSVGSACASSIDNPSCNGGVAQQNKQAESFDNPMVSQNKNSVSSKDERAEDQSKTPEEELLSKEPGQGGFIWDNIPTIAFEDIAGLEEVKNVVRVKVLLPLKNPEAFKGYEKKNGGGLCLYGPPGTGKTMIAAAIAHEIGAKFCSVKPSDLLQQGAGNTEKAVRSLFQQARNFPCAVIYFDEMDSISPKSTKSQYAKQLRSEFLAQLQGVESYGEDSGNILFLICATNKPWDIDSAFLRPGRFGTKIYVGLPDAPAREYMIQKRLSKIVKNGVVAVHDNIDMGTLVEKTSGFNGSDMSNLLDRVEELSILRGIDSGEKYIDNCDFEDALLDINSSVQMEDLVRLKEWKDENDK